MVLSRVVCTEFTFYPGFVGLLSHLLSQLLSYALYRSFAMSLAPLKLNKYFYVDENGNTPLHLAASSGDVMLVKLHLQWGAILQLNKQGLDPLDLAKEKIMELDLKEEEEWMKYNKICGLLFNAKYGNCKSD